MFYHPFRIPTRKSLEFAFIAHYTVFVVGLDAKLLG